MAPKKRTQKKLRQELNEYTSLIRTLHATSTQNLLPHLTGAFPRPPSVPSSNNSRRGRSSSVASPSRSSQPSPSRAISRRLEEFEDTQSEEGNGERLAVSAASGENTASRDIWTRWPLLRDTVYVPEWTLQDEVRSIAEKSARGWLQTYGVDAELPSPDVDADMKDESSEEHGSNSSLEDQGSSVPLPQRSPDAMDQGITEQLMPLPEEDMLTNGALNGLFLDASNLLGQTFATLAAHRPAVDPGLQNRLRSMDWKSAFSILASAGIVDPRIMQDVQERIERIYGDSNSQVLRRLEVQRATKRKLHDLEESFGTRGDIFHFTHPRKVRKTKSAKGDRLKSTRISAKPEIDGSDMSVDDG